MMKKVSCLVAAGVFCSAALVATNTEAARAPSMEGFGLWEHSVITSGGARFIPHQTVDRIPNLPGLEFSLVNQSWSLSTPDANGKVVTTYAVTSEGVDANGAPTGSLGPVSIASAPFPDFNDPANQPGGANFTVYYGTPLGAGNPPLNGFALQFTTSHFPFPGPFGTGLASKRSTGARVALWGNSVEGSYTSLADGFVNVSRYQVSAFNASTGALLWSMELDGTAADGRQLDTGTSGVADFLGNGDDEIRIMDFLVEADGSTTWRVRYFDIETGAEIGSFEENVPVP